MFVRRLGLQASLASFIALSFVSASRAQSADGVFTLTSFSESNRSSSLFSRDGSEGRNGSSNGGQYDGRYETRDRINVRELSAQAARLESMTRSSLNYDLRYAGSRIFGDAQSLERCAQTSGRRPAPGPGYPYPGNPAPISDPALLKQACGYELKQLLISLSEIEFQLIGTGTREPGIVNQVQRIARLKDQMIYEGSSGGGGYPYPPAPPAYRATGSVDSIRFDYIGESPSEIRSQCQMDLARRGINLVGCVTINGQSFGQMCRMPPNGGVSRGMSTQEACSIVAQNAIVLPRP